jgi:8-oxo-dGTP pyrophosphatase MutT (NUDIX family)
MKVKNETSAGGIVYKIIKHPTSNIKHVQWLICQHSQHKGWVFPKGLVGDKIRDEPMEVAALRETEEEGGVKAKIVGKTPITVQYMYQFQGYLIKKTVYYFLMEYVSGDPNDHDWEMDEAKFVPEEEIEKLLTYKSDKEAFEKVLLLFKNNEI